MDQCMGGCKDDNGVPVRKRTEWKGSHEALLVTLAQMQCDNKHYPANPTGKQFEKLKHYPLGVCNAVVDGIIALRQSHTLHAYPVVDAGTGPDDPSKEPDRAPLGGMGCPACHNRTRRDSPLHTRVKGQCRWHDVEPVVWECPACNEARPIDGKHRQAHAPYLDKPGACRF